MVYSILALENERKKNDGVEANRVTFDPGSVHFSIIYYMTSFEFWSLVDQSL